MVGLTVEKLKFVGTHSEKIEQTVIIDSPNDVTIADIINEYDMIGDKAPGGGDYVVSIKVNRQI